MSLLVLKNDLIVYETLSQFPRLARPDTKNIGVGKTGQKGINRDGLVELTRLSRTTIYDALVRLDLKGLVENFSEERDKRGRPKEFFLLNLKGER